MYDGSVARRIPEHRFDDLIRAATEVFISQGYRRTQMADVAAALGVAKGTLYGYVQGKEALFQLAARYSDSPGPVGPPAELPLPTPKPGELLGLFRERVAREGDLPRLTEALERGRAADVRRELETVLRELYSVMARNHRGIKLIDRCALDHPELAAEWQKAGREAPLGRLTEYLEARIRARQLRPVHDTRLAARLVLETITTWTVHIKWDRSPQEFDPEAAEENGMQFLLRCLLPDGEHGSTEREEKA
jgi:AcrR family transcriptional regulator